MSAATLNGSHRRRQAIETPTASATGKRSPKFVAVQAKQERLLADAKERRRLFIECGANAGLIDLLERVKELQLRALTFVESYPPSYFQKLYRKHGVRPGDTMEEFNPACISDNPNCSHLALLDHLAEFIFEKGYIVALTAEPASPSAD